MKPQEDQIDSTCPRTPSRRRFLLRVVLLSIVLVLLGVLGYVAAQIGYTVTSYAAKQVCSLGYITGQSSEEVMAELDEDNPLIKYIKATKQDDQHAVTATIFGLCRREAVFSPTYGGVVRHRGYDLPELELPEDPPDESNFPFVTADQIGAAFPIIQVDRAAMDAVMDYAFSEPEDGVSKRRTRAVLIVWQNQIIAEQYHPDFDADSVLLGWSMAKSMLSLAIGMRVHQGGMSLEADHLRPEWSKDERRNIRLEQLLRMESGLVFDEDYENPLAHALTMLSRRADMAGYAASFPRKYGVDGPALFGYSSGTSNILSEQLRRSFANDQAYHDFLRSDFLHRLGIRTARLEFDASGTWVGSSFMWATAREWARLGKFALDDGMWNGARLLPEGWMAKSVLPTDSYSNQLEAVNPSGLAYGMHWWLNRKNAAGENWMPDVPEDLFTSWGHAGQFVTVIPSKQLIAVRLGLKRGPDGWDHARFMTGVLNAINE